MPSYNSAPYLKEAVESILGQSFHDFELIIVDDGSTDNSPGLLAQYAARDRRIRILRNDVNRGIVFALNRGLEMCRGEYLVRMDADDIAMPDRLERQIAFMDAHPDVAALGASLRYIDAGGQDMNRVRHCAIRKSLSLTAQTPLLHPTVVMRRAVLRQHGLRYQERYRYAEDYYLWLQLSRFGKLAALDDVVIRYRVSENATRFRNLKGVLWATVRAKTAAVFRLGIRPRLTDFFRFSLECVLLILPSFLVRRLYLQFGLRKQTRGAP